MFLLFDRYSCPNGVRIVGRWCSTPCVVAKDTLDSVLFYSLRYFLLIIVVSSLGVFSFNTPPLLLHTILIHLLRCLHRLPCPRQVNYLLFPPPHPHSCPLLSLLRITEVQRQLPSNILHDRILPLSNVCLHQLKPHSR